jgi:SAM-dependent methyltransferase
MTRNLDLEASEYSPAGATYTENDLMLNWYPQRITSRLAPHSSILELGLGHGFTAAHFNVFARRHVILDGSPLVIAQYKQRHPDSTSEIIETFFEQFETAERFDAIVMGFVLEHVDDPVAVLSRFRQFLEPEGSLYVAVPNAKSLNRRLGLELGLIDDIYSLNANDRALGHLRQYCVDSLRAQVEGCGYRIGHVEGIYLKPLPLKVLLGLENPEANMQAMLRVGVDFPELCVAILMQAFPSPG